MIASQERWWRENPRTRGPSTQMISVVSNTLSRNWGNTWNVNNISTLNLECMCMESTEWCKFCNHLQLQSSVSCHMQTSESYCYPWDVKTSWSWNPNSSTQAMSSPDVGHSTKSVCRFSAPDWQTFYMSDPVRTCLLGIERERALDSVRSTRLWGKREKFWPVQPIY